MAAFVVTSRFDQNWPVGLQVNGGRMSVDEPTVAYWHDLAAGFRGRQPLEP